MNNKVWEAWAIQQNKLGFLSYISFYLQLLLQPWAWFTRFMVDDHFLEMLGWIPRTPSNTDQYNCSRMFREGPGENEN